MRKILTATVVAVACVLGGCGDSGIGPEPQTTTSSGNSMGGDGQGGSGANNSGGAQPSGGNGPTGGSTPGGGNESGSRIKAKHRVGSDGSRRDFGWYDSQLATSCQWRLSGDGQERCLPEGITATRYADNACSVPLIVQSECEPLDYALVGEPANTCGATRYRVYPVGAAVSPATVYTLNNSVCSTTSVPSGDLFTTGAELPASGFVASTEEIDD